jgi:hypothetical protein
MYDERYKQLDFDAYNGIGSKKLRDEVGNLIESGRVNANDTVHVDKAAADGEWDSVFVGSIRSLLSDGTYSKRCVRWFAARGIKA